MVMRIPKKLTQLILSSYLKNLADPTRFERTISVFGESSQDSLAVDRPTNREVIADEFVASAQQGLVRLGPASALLPGSLTSRGTARGARNAVRHPGICMAEVRGDSGKTGASLQKVCGVGVSQNV
jgi:hypothetical protein